MELNLPPFDEGQLQDTPAPTPAPDAPAAASPSHAVDTPAPTPEPIAPADTLYEVKINGKTFQVPLSELTAGYQRQADYTRKTTALAERQREFDRIAQEHQRYTQEREQLRQFLADPAAVRAYLESLGQVPSGAPDQPITAAQLAQLQERQAALHQQQMEQRMQQMTAELEVRQTAARYAAEIDATIQSAINQFPELKNVRRIDRILREEVAERQPSNVEEAKQLFLQVAKEQADSLRTFAESEKKRAAAQAAQLKNGIEPPGGTGIQPKPEKLSLGSAQLRQVFEDSLRGSGS